MSGTNSLKNLIEDDPHSAGPSYQKMTSMFEKFMKSSVKIDI
jgi:hypothetical protein